MIEQDMMDAVLAEVPEGSNAYLSFFIDEGEQVLRRTVEVVSILESIMMAAFVQEFWNVAACLTVGETLATSKVIYATNTFLELELSLNG